MHDQTSILLGPNGVVGDWGDADIVLLVMTREVFGMRCVGTGDGRGVIVLLLVVARFVLGRGDRTG